MTYRALILNNDSIETSFVLGVLFQSIILCVVFAASFVLGVLFQECILLCVVLGVYSLCVVLGVYSCVCIILCVVLGVYSCVCCFRSVFFCVLFQECILLCVVLGVYSFVCCFMCVLFSVLFYVCIIQCVVLCVYYLVCCFMCVLFSVLFYVCIILCVVVLCVYQFVCMPIALINVPLVIVFTFPMKHNQMCTYANRPPPSPYYVTVLCYSILYNYNLLQSLAFRLAFQMALCYCCWYHVSCQLWCVSIVTVFLIMSEPFCFHIALHQVYFVYFI